MAFDRNPKFGRDQHFSESAQRAADLLWETTNGDVTSFPRSYLENLRHEFSDGKVSMLEIIDRVDLGEDATYEDYCEVVNKLICVDPNKWPEPDKVVETPSSHLLYSIEPEVDFSEFEDFEEEGEEVSSNGMSEKMELFFKKVISSVYMDGVTDVTDAEGNPPSEANNYLLSEDGKVFQGIFYDSAVKNKEKQFPFRISEKSEGVWTIEY